MKLLIFATQGSSGSEEHRIKELLIDFDVVVFPFLSGTIQRKIKSALQLFRAIRKNEPDLVVMEGSGIFAGLVLILSRIIYSRHYVISSGDAIAPYVFSLAPWVSPFFFIYEVVLYKLSSGFIGWTPYLSGRALTFGAPKAAVAAGWAPFPTTTEENAASRIKIRDKHKIPHDFLVIGIVGSLAWNRRVKYCYGLELIEAILKTHRSKIAVLIVGDGTGMPFLKEKSKGQLDKKIYLSGKVSKDEVPLYLAAMDAASLPQSLDQVGSFRYTTKISEYLAAKTPVITGQIPCAYDLDEGWLWRIPGQSPWDSKYIKALTNWMNELTVDELEKKKKSIPDHHKEFNYNRQRERIKYFIQDIINDLTIK